MRPTPGNASAAVGMTVTISEELMGLLPMSGGAERFVLEFDLSGSELKRAEQLQHKSTDL